LLILKFILLRRFNSTLVLDSIDISSSSDTNIPDLTINYTSSFIPPAPVYASSTTGNFRVNQSWQARAGNITDTYTVSFGQQLAIYPTYSDVDSDTPTFADSTGQKGLFYTINGTFLWTPAGGDVGTYNWYINVTDGYGSTSTKSFGVSVGSSAVPGQPINIGATTGNFWVNTTWNTSVNTNTFNISFNNGSWLNGSTANFIKHPFSAHAWQNVSVAGYNTTSKNLGMSANLSTQIPNNPLHLGLHRPHPHPYTPRITRSYQYQSQIWTMTQRPLELE
jgi:hypothetical protein